MKNMKIKIENALKSQIYPDLRKLICLEIDGKILVQGMVNSFYLKQLAQTLVLKHDSNCEFKIEVNKKNSDFS